jgi:hypothetical protein
LRVHSNGFSGRKDNAPFLALSYQFFGLNYQAGVFDTPHLNEQSISKRAGPKEHKMRKLTKLLDLKSVLVATAIAIALACHPGAALAQTQVAAVGADGYTRAMWRGTDGSISLWKLDPVLNFVGNHVFGPYSGWSPVALTMLGDNTYLLWRYTDGTANIWVLDANLNVFTSRTFGPVGGRVPDGIGVDPYGNVRLVWKTPANQVAVWVINAALNVIGGSPTYGPYFGWSF